MKVVHWGKYYYPDVGGIETVTRSLAEGAAAAGYRVSVVCFEKTRSFEAYPPEANVEVVRVPTQSIISSQPLGLRYWTTIRRSARSADVVHVHVPNMFAALAATLLPSDVRLVVHWHSDIVSKGRLAKWLKPIESKMLERADRIVTTSQRYAEASPALRPYLGKVSVVPIGVPDCETNVPNNDSSIPNDLIAWIEGDRFILSIGRLVSYKGFDVLIDAAQHISSAKVIIVGKGPLENDLRQRVRTAGVDDKVLIAGYLPPSALDALLRRASLYCLPSVERSEAFGVVLLEAMSYGLPLVATDIPGSGVPWVNRHDVSGINVPPNDAKALAEACEGILRSDELRLKLSQGSRQRFQNEFEDKKSVEKMLKIYRDLMEDGT